MRSSVAVAICALSTAALAVAASAFAQPRNAHASSSSVLFVSRGDFVVFDGTNVGCFVYGPAGAFPGASGIVCTPAKPDAGDKPDFLNADVAGLLTVCCPGGTSLLEFDFLARFVDIVGTQARALQPYVRHKFHVPLYGAIRLRAEHDGGTLACQGAVNTRIEKTPHVTCLIVNPRTFTAKPDGMRGYFYSASKTDIGFDKPPHNNTVLVHGESGFLVKMREARLDPHPAERPCESRVPIHALGSSNAPAGARPSRRSRAAGRSAASARRPVS